MRSVSKAAPGPPPTAHVVSTTAAAEKGTEMTKRASALAELAAAYTPAPQPEGREEKKRGASPNITVPSVVVLVRRVKGTGSPAQWVVNTPQAQSTETSTVGGGAPGATATRAVSAPPCAGAAAPARAAASAAPPATSRVQPPPPWAGNVAPAAPSFSRGAPEVTQASPDSATRGADEAPGAAQAVMCTSVALAATPLPMGGRESPHASTMGPCDGSPGKPAKPPTSRDSAEVGASAATAAPPGIPVTGAGTVMPDASAMAQPVPAQPHAHSVATASSKAPTAAPLAGPPQHSPSAMSSGQPAGAGMRSVAAVGDVAQARAPPAAPPCAYASSCKSEGDCPSATQPGPPPSANTASAVPSAPLTGSLVAALQVDRWRKATCAPVPLSTHAVLLSGAEGSGKAEKSGNQGRLGTL